MKNNGINNYAFAARLLVSVKVVEYMQIKLNISPSRLKLQLRLCAHQIIKTKLIRDTVKEFSNENTYFERRVAFKCAALEVCSTLIKER